MEEKEIKEIKETKDIDHEKDYYTKQEVNELVNQKIIEQLTNLLKSDNSTKTEPKNIEKRENEEKIEVYEW